MRRQSKKEARRAGRAKRRKSVGINKIIKWPKSWQKQAPKTERDLKLQAKIDADPPGKGQRHSEMMSLGAKMIWANHMHARDEESLVAFFRKRYAGGLPKMQLRRNVRDLFSYSERSQMTRECSSDKKRRKGKSPRESRKPKSVTCHSVAKGSADVTGIEEIDFHQASPRYLNPWRSQHSLLSAMFNPDEFVAIRTNYYAQKATVRACREWLLIGEHEDDPFKQQMAYSWNGAWLNLNPLKARKFAGDNPRKEDIAAYRHMLVESDVLPLSKQRDIIGTFIPKVVAVVNTAGKSYHCVIRVDAKSAEEYAHIQDAHQQCLRPLGFDVQAMGYWGMVRLPFCYRGDDRQNLIYLNPRPLDEPIFKDPNGRGRRWYECHHNLFRYSLKKKGGDI